MDRLMLGVGPISTEIRKVVRAAVIEGKNVMDLIAARYLPVDERPDVPRREPFILQVLSGAVGKRLEKSLPDRHIEIRPQSVPFRPVSASIANIDNRYMGQKWIIASVGSLSVGMHLCRS